MKKLFTSMFAMATLLTASAQMASGVQARVYAYNLQQNQTTLDDGVNTYTITFQTNCAASEGAKVCLLNENGETVYEVAATAIDDTQKSWSATVDVYVLQDMGYTPEAGDYNWSVEVSAPAVENFQMISANASSSDFSFYRSYGVAVDKAPESDYFGRVYVVNQKEGTTTGALVNRTAEVGIYSFTPNLMVENNGAVNTCSVVGDYAKSGDGPSDMIVGPDGNIYLAVRATNKSDIYTVNPNDFSASNIFYADGLTRNDNGQIMIDDETYVVGVPYGVGVRGIGDDRELYVINGQENLTYGIDNVNRYKIGSANTWNSAPTSSVYAWTYYDVTAESNKQVRIYSTYCAIEPIVTGGYWVSFYYSTSYGGVTNIPTLVYFDDSNSCKFNFEGEGLASTGYGRNGALAVDENRGVVVYGDGKNATFLKYTTNDDNTITVDTESLTKLTLENQGSYSNSFDFDYAGNLYSTTSSGSSTNKGEMMAVFAVPDEIMGENKRVTPAKSNLLVSLTENDITTGIVEVGVDADAAVEYYNLQGVKVANPSNGVFIKKQGNKTTKVVL